MSINQRIKQVRQVVGISQAKFSKRIAISTGYIAEIELGRKKVTERIVRLISMEFAINEHWLWTGEGSMFNNEPEKKVLKAISLFKLLNPPFQDYAISNLNELVKLYDSLNKQDKTNSN